MKRSFLIRIGTVVALCVAIVLSALYWPVSQMHWRKSSLLLENRYVFAVACGTDTLYFADADTVAGIRDESFCEEEPMRTQWGIGYFSTPFGRITGKAMVLVPICSMDSLRLVSDAVLQRTQQRVEQQQEVLVKQLQELTYYEQTHMKDDDGFVEMQSLHQNRLQYQQHLDSLQQFLTKALENPSAVTWTYLPHLSAYLPDSLNYAMPCMKPKVKGDKLYCRLLQEKPKGTSSIYQPFFNMDKQKLDELAADSTRSYVGWVDYPEGRYEGMMKAGKPEGSGCMVYKDGSRYQGSWILGVRCGKGDMQTAQRVHLNGEWLEDYLLSGKVCYADGRRYEGSLLDDSIPDGAGDMYDTDGSVYWGTWDEGERQGFGMAVTADGAASCGTWEDGIFKGERLLYTADRVYGIDIARYQHLNSRKRASNIAWKYVRITSLGQYSRKRIKEKKVSYPISFVYVKCTEGTTVTNQYYTADTKAIRDLNIHTGAYHFFQGTPAREQLQFFLKNVQYQKGDLPPVLDLEPTDAEITKKWGSDEKMFQEVMVFMNGVEKALDVRPILYVNQTFIKNHLSKASEEVQSYDLWIARYGEFKPYSHLVYWQLSPDGKVDGIQSDVDINVFNGSKDKFEEYMKSFQE